MVVRLALLSAIYILAFGFVAGFRPACPDYSNATWLSMLNLHARYLACRPLNELGDFLAGVFAPLALVWLAAAVFIQSRELAAQREELELTRIEARETREVLREQAAESRAATKFIGEQTEILVRQQVMKEQQQADKEFDELVESFHREWPSGSKLPIVATARSTAVDGYVSTDRLRWGSRSAGEPLSFLDLLQNAEAAQHDLDTDDENYVVSVDYVDDSAFDVALAALRSMIARVPRLSQAHNLKAMSLAIGQLPDQLEAVRSRAVARMRRNDPAS